MSRQVAGPTRRHTKPKTWSPRVPRFKAPDHDLRENDFCVGNAVFGREKARCGNHGFEHLGDNLQPDVMVAPFLSRGTGKFNSATHAAIAFERCGCETLLHATDPHLHRIRNPRRGWLWQRAGDHHFLEPAQIDPLGDHPRFPVMGLRHLLFADAGMSDEPFVLPESALEERFLAATGPGGQNVNKVATAVQIRLDVYGLRLFPSVYARLKTLAGSRWTNEGEIVLTARSFRTQEANRADARRRLTELVQKAHQAPVRRIKTKPSRTAKEKRLTGKAIRGDVKKARGKVSFD